MSDSPELLSVVVPAYNVEEYLRECIESVVSSTYSPLEVIIVDDGSTDDTPRAADSLASKYPNVRVIHRENGGLSAARNTGVGAADGKYLAFVDSDDIVPNGAYSAMISSLGKTGSQFVVGAVERFNSTRTWKPWFVDEAHGALRQGITGQEFPPILWNVFAWDKVFRRHYFIRELGGFPEGEIYEDQELSARAYLSGARFDVLEEIVYRWRSREDGTSITENKTSLYDLEQRLAAASKTADTVRGLGDAGAIEYWYRKLLNEDLWWYFRVVPKTDGVYWAVLRDALRRFAADAPPSALVFGPPKRAELISLCLQDRRAAFEDRLKRP